MARPNTADRWAAALARAQDAGLHVFTVNGDPRHWGYASKTP